MLCSPFLRKLFVRLSYVWTLDCDKTKKSFARIFTLHERTFILVFQHEEWLVGDDPFYLKFWAKTNHVVEKNGNFQSIFPPPSASALIFSEKIQLS